MDPKELRGLMEAYAEVYAPEQIDEVLDTPEKANEYAKKNVKSMVGAFVKGAVNKDISQLKTIEKRKRGAELAKRKAARKAAEEQNEDFELWVNGLVEEGYDLSEYTWEEMYEAYIEEAPNLGTGGTAQDMINRRQAAKTKAGGTLGAGGGQAAMRKLQSQGVDARSAYAKVHSQGERNLSAAAKPPAAKPPAAKQPTTAPAARPSGGAPAARPAASAPASRPSATPAARPAASSSAAKPAPAAAKPAPAKPAGSAMDQWAKANPRLAQAQKIRQQGGSRAEVNKSLYNKGTAAATSTPTVVKAGVDLFDIVRGYLLDGGYAETLEEAEWMMANLIDEEAIDIILGEEQLDEISNKTVSSALNARIANTGAAIDRENKNRTPQNVRDTVRAADKESSMRSAVAKRRARMAKEEFAIDEASRADEFTRAAIARSSGRKGGVTFEPGPNWDPSANRGKGAHISPKQKEKQRRKALRQEAFEAWLDEALTGERYKKVMNKPGWRNYARMHSEDPAKRPTKRGGRGEKGLSKQHDFGAADRGTGNKAARRAGKPVYDSRQEED